MATSIPPKCGNNYFVEHNVSNIVVHSTVLFELPISVFAIYCILFVTPKRSQMIKVLLLLHQFWVNYYSMMFNTGLSPVFFFPKIVMYTRGVFDYFEVSVRLQVYLLSTAFAGMLYSIFSLFVYRHQCVLRETHPLKMSTKTFVVFMIFLNFMSIIYMVPFFLTEPIQSSSIEDVRRNFFNPPCDLWDPHLYAFIDESNLKILFGYGIVIFITSSCMFFLSFHSFHSIRKSGTIASKSSQKRQIGFLYALILMALIPNILLVCPVFAMIFGSIHSTIYNPALGELLVCSLSIHGIVSTLTLIFSHKPYRVETSKLMRKIVCKKSDVKKGVIQVEGSSKSTKY